MNPLGSVRRIASSVLVALLLAWSSAAAAVSAAMPEADVKAALVLNFARYVDWPAAAFATPDAPYVICLMGGDALRPAFTALEGKMLKGRAVRVRGAVGVDDARGCHVVYVADEPVRGRAATLRALGGLGILTVSDLDGFIDSGGAIGIVPGDERLQFEINRDALDRAGLTASSQLLKLARALIGRGS